MEELDRQPNRGNTIFWSILFALVLAIFVGVSVYFGHDRIAKSINPEKENVSQEPQTEVEPVLTVQDVLQARNDLKESQRVDSVFLSLSDVILVDILMTHGTSLSNSDIVYIYESNKEHFKDVLKGAVIQRDIITPMDSVKNPRDSLRCQRVIIKTSYYSFLKHFAQKWFKNFDTTSLFVRIDQSSEDDKPVGRKQICLVKRIRPT